MNHEFQRLTLLYGPDAVDRLRNSRAIIFGVGGVGSWCAEALARCAIGTITIVDSDCVDPTNINRQLVALNSTVGIPKVTVMAERIADINPDCKVSAINGRYTSERADEFHLEDYDVIIDAIDSLADKADLIARATSMERPRIFSSMGAALKTDPSKIETAEFWQVKGCPLARALRQRFKRTGIFPRRKFRCVFSPEIHPNAVKDTEGEHLPNGTVVFATADFGLRLASLAVNYLLTR